MCIYIYVFTKSTQVVQVFRCTSPCTCFAHVFVCILCSMQSLCNFSKFPPSKLSRQGVFHKTLKRLDRFGPVCTFKQCIAAPKNSKRDEHTIGLGFVYFTLFRFKWFKMQARCATHPRCMQTGVRLVWIGLRLKPNKTYQNKHTFQKSFQTPCC